MDKNFGSGVVGGVVLIDPATGQPYKATGGGGDGVSSWDDLEDKPPVIAAGPDADTARAAIGAGTSSLAIGSTGSTAKAGNWTPAVGDLPTSVPIDVFQGSGGTWPSTPAAAGQRTNWVGYPGLSTPPAMTGRPAGVSGLDSYVLRESS